MIIYSLFQIPSVLKGKNSNGGALAPAARNLHFSMDGRRSSDQTSTGSVSRYLDCSASYHKICKCNLFD